MDRGRLAGPAARKELLQIEQVVHGGRALERELTDFSVCLNPFPLPDSVQKALGRADSCRYPDSNGRSLQEALARHHQCDPEEILLTNGISQAIFLTAFAYLERGDRVLIAGPTYGEYEKNCRIMGAETETSNAFSPGEPGTPGSGITSSLIRHIEEGKPKIFWICNPNNPTGALLPREEMGKLHAACLKAGSLMVTDEAYMNFTDPERRFSAGAESAGNTGGAYCLTLHSMTKDFSIPGLRLGYIKGARELIKPIAAARPEWSLNAFALAAGEAALDALEDFVIQWGELRRETLLLAEELGGLGLQLLPPAANCILFRDPLEVERTKGKEAAGGNLGDLLAREGMVLRDCSSFGLPGWYRIGTNRPEANRRLIETIRSCFTGKEKRS